MKNVICLVLCFVLFLSAPMTVSAEKGPAKDWDGHVNTTVANPYLFLEASIVRKMIVENDNLDTVHSYVATYKGNSTIGVNVSNMDVGTFLYGHFVTRVNVDLSSVPVGNMIVRGVVPDADVQVYDGYFVSLYNVNFNLTANTCTYDLRVDFDGYRCDSDSLYIPIDVNYTVAVNHSGDDGVSTHFACKIASSHDWAGEVWQYDDLQDMDTNDSYFANQNQEVIDGVTEQNKLQNQGNQLQQQGNQLQNQGNLLQQQGNQLQEEQNKFQQNIDSGVDDIYTGVNSDLNSGFSDFDDAQSDLLGNSFDTLSSVDFNAALPNELGKAFVTAFTWVGGCMENLYVMTEFGAVFNITAVLLLACLLLGIRRLWR